MAVACSPDLFFSSKVCDSIADSLQQGQEQESDTELIFVQLLIILSLGAGFPTVLWPCRDAVVYVLIGAPPSPPLASTSGGTVVMDQPRGEVGGAVVAAATAALTGAVESGASSGAVAAQQQQDGLTGVGIDDDATKQLTETATERQAKFQARLGTVVSVLLWAGSIVTAMFIEGERAATATIS